MVKHFLAALAVLLFALPLSAQKSDLGDTHQHFGVLLAKSGNQTLTTASGADQTWETETYDLGGWHASSSADVVIPAGVTYIRAVCSIVFAANTTGRRTVSIKVEDASVAGANSVTYAATPNGFAIVQAVSAVIAVSLGDDVSCSAYQNSGGNLDVVAGGATYFYVERVQ